MSDAPLRSTQIAYYPKLLTLAQDIWLPIYTDVGITNEFTGKGGYWGLVNNGEGQWWLYGKRGLKWDGASWYPDYDYMIMPSLKHDCLHWGIRYGVIPERSNNLIDKELGETIRRQEHRFWLRNWRAWKVERATRLVDEHYDPSKPLHEIKRITI